MTVTPPTPAPATPGGGGGTPRRWTRRWIIIAALALAGLVLLGLWLAGAFDGSSHKASPATTTTATTTPTTTTTSTTSSTPTATTPTTTTTTTTTGATVPAQPTIVMVTPGATQTALVWKAGSDGGSPITSYSVYRGTSPGSETLLAGSLLSTNYVDTAVVASNTYYYQVSASNAVGESPRSGELAIATSAPASTPGGSTASGATSGSSTGAGGTSGGTTKGGGITAKTTVNPASTTACGGKKPGYSGYVATAIFPNGPLIPGGQIPVSIRVCRYGAPQKVSVTDEVAFGYSIDGQPATDFAVLHYRGAGSVQLDNGNYFVLPSPLMPVGATWPLPVNMDVPTASTGMYHRLCLIAFFAGYGRYPSLDPSGNAVPSWHDDQVQPAGCKSFPVT